MVTAIFLNDGCAKGGVKLRELFNWDGVLVGLVERIYSGRLPKNSNNKIKDNYAVLLLLGVFSLNILRGSELIVLARGVPKTTSFPLPEINKLLFSSSKIDLICFNCLALTKMLEFS